MDADAVDHRAVPAIQILNNPALTDVRDEKMFAGKFRVFRERKLGGARSTNPKGMPVQFNSPLFQAWPVDEKESSGVCRM